MCQIDFKMNNHMEKQQCRHYFQRTCPMAASCAERERERRGNERQNKDDDDDDNNNTIPIRCIAR